MKKFNVFLLIAIAVVLNTASTYAQSVCSKNAKSVYFQSNQSVLTADHKKMIDEIIKTRKSEIYLEIKGHTDSVGSHEFNNKLSEKRAKAVADYIIANSKFNKKDIRVSFYGKNNPVNVNDLAKNRNQRLLSTYTVDYDTLDEYDKMKLVYEYVQKHFADKITLEDAANIASMSIISFNRFIKKRTGKPVRFFCGAGEI